MTALTFRDAQTRCWANKLAKGFNTTDVAAEFRFLRGEVDEAEAAWSAGAGLAHELADIALYVSSLAQMCGIDLGQAVAEKMAINEGRTYVRDIRTGALVKAVKR